MANLIIKGGFFIWPILLCSVVSLTVILERFRYFYRTRSKDRNLPERAQALINANKADEAFALCEKERSFIGRFLAVGIKVIGRPAKDGNIFFNGKKVTPDNLAVAIKAGINKSKSKTVVIKADEAVNLGLAVKVMDIAKEANADGLVISTKTANDENDK